MQSINRSALHLNMLTGNQHFYVAILFIYGVKTLIIIIINIIYFYFVNFITCTTAKIRFRLTLSLYI